MDLEDLKKPFYILLALAGLGWYVSNHYTFKDVLAYSKQHPHPEYSPMLDYYSGMAYFARDQHEDAIEAFNQLLTDYPTCPYAARAMHRLGTSYMERNNYQAAREIFDRYFEEHPAHRDRQVVQQKYEYIKFK